MANCNSCTNPMNWFFKILLLIVLLFILGSSLYYYYHYNQNQRSLNNIKQREFEGR